VEATEQQQADFGLFRDPSVEDASMMLLPTSSFLERLTKLERMTSAEIAGEGGAQAVLGPMANCDVQEDHINVKASTTCHAGASSCACPD
jgi:hypothetical protein